MLYDAIPMKTSALFESTRVTRPPRTSYDDEKEARRPPKELILIGIREMARFDIEGDGETRDAERECPTHGRMISHCQIGRNDSHHKRRQGRVVDKISIDEMLDEERQGADRGERLLRTSPHPQQHRK